ncbi:hypothetical protein ACWGCW_38475 [Streptomyces sp. NPDC054933]
MTVVSPPVWRATGLVWTDGQVFLEWSGPGTDATRSSPVPLGAELAVICAIDRRCVGV